MGTSSRVGVHSITTTVCDARKGLNVTGATLEFGLLSVSKDKLVFVQKPPLTKDRVATFPYEDIEIVTFTKGLIFGSMSVWVDGTEERFDKFIASDAENLSRCVESKIGWLMHLFGEISFPSESSYQAPPHRTVFTYTDAEFNRDAL